MSVKIDKKYDDSLKNPTCNNPYCQRGAIFATLKGTMYHYIFKCKCSPKMGAPFFDFRMASNWVLEKDPYRISNEEKEKRRY